MKKLFIRICWQLFVLVFTASTALAGYGLMLGSFRERSNAEKYMSDFLVKYDDMGLTAFIEESNVQGRGLWYRVCVGPYGSKNEAAAQQKDIKADGLESIVVIVRSEPEVDPNMVAVQEEGNKPFGTGNDQKRIDRVPMPPLISPNPPSRTITPKKETIGKKRFQIPNAEHPLNAQEGGSDGPKNQRSGQEESLEGFNSPSSPSNDTGIIEPGDVLSIEIPGQKEMSQLYDVDPDGNIYMLTVGGIRVNGLNTESLVEKIAIEIKQLIGKGQLPTARIEESQRYINIQGGVDYPGWYRVPQISKLDGLLSMAGGLISGVDISQIRLKRKTKNGYTEIRIKNTLSLKPNDILSVPIPKEFAKTIDNGDLLFINIPSTSKPSELSEIERKVVENQVQVDQNGYIYIPDYGHIYVKDKTIRETSRIIAEKLPRYLAKSARVHVNIVEKRHYIQILGHVAEPGWYDVPETSNLQSALSVAGGATDGAIMSNITITRKWEGLVHRFRVNLYQFTITGDIRLLPPIHENDTIFVPISSSFGNVKRTLSVWQPPPDMLEEDTGVKVRIFGAVHHPGTYETKENMDILDLLISAGGNRDDADLTRTLLMRDNKSTAYDLNELILQNASGLQGLPEVRSGDSVYIPYVKKAGYEKQDPKEMVRIFGAVQQPGIYEMVDNMNLMDVLTLANGITYDADQANVMLVKADGSSKMFNLKNFFDLKEGDREETPMVSPGETIYVHFLQREGMKEPDPKKMIRIIGAVKHPGVFEPIKEGNLLDAVSLARGMTYDADLAKVVITRRDGSFEKFDLQEFLDDKTPDSKKLPLIFPSDTIYVHYLQHLGLEDAEPIYVLGKVGSPGQYSLSEEGMTVFQVIALAGGLDEWADTDEILVIRTVDGKQQNIPYNWRKAISGKYPELNIRLRAFDTVYVP